MNDRIKKSTIMQIIDDELEHTRNMARHYQQWVDYIQWMNGGQIPSDTREPDAPIHPKELREAF